MSAQSHAEVAEEQIVVDLTLSERVALASATATHRPLDDGTVLVEMPVFPLENESLPRLRSRSTIASRLRMRFRRP